MAVKEKILELLLLIDRSTLNASDQLSYDVYQSYLNFEIEAATYRSFQYPATYGFFGWPGDTEIFFTQVMQINNKQDADNYLRLLNQLGRRFAQIENLLDARASDGIIEPALTFDYSQSQVDNLANTMVTSISYYQAFVDMVSPLTNITNAEKQELYQLLNLIVSDRLIPAYRSLSQKMTMLLADAPSQLGFGQFDGGDAFYQFQLRYFTNSDMTPEQVHQLGLDELVSIQDQMNSRFDQLGYPANETLVQKFDRLEQDAGFIQGDQAIATYEAIIDAAYAELPAVFSSLPQQEVVVIGGTSGGYYIAGSDDGSRPGAFYANTSSATPYTTMLTLAYHEAVPGHHLQIALARELDLPTFRQKTNFTSFVEGWGLYAERLAYDLGWYANDIYGDLGRLQFEAMRASRLVLDTGIHFYGWSYQQADNFSLENVGMPGSIARIASGQAKQQPTLSVC